MSDSRGSWLVAGRIGKGTLGAGSFPMGNVARAPGAGVECISGAGPWWHLRAAAHHQHLMAQGVVPFLGTFIMYLDRLDIAMKDFVDVSELAMGGAGSRTLRLGGRVLA